MATVRALLYLCIRSWWYAGDGNSDKIKFAEETNARALEWEGVVRVLVCNF